MSRWFASLRTKLRRRDRKDAAIVVLALLLAATAAFAFRDRLSALSGGVGWGGFSGPGKEAVAVFDVVLDRDDRQWVDLLFDRPLGKGREGEVLETPPATVEPALAGVWRWRDAGVLRFEPVGGFPMASRHTLALIADRLLAPGQRFAGKTAFDVVTDQFLVEGVEVAEEPVFAGAGGEGGEAKGRVIFRGTLRFNYPVNPEQLAPRIRLLDPGSATPIAVEVEATWPQASLGFHTAAVQKTKQERTVTLVIDSALTPDEGNVPLAAEFRHEIAVGSSEKLAVREVGAEPGLAESSLRVVFSSPVEPAVAGRYLSVEPAVKYRLAADRNTLSLTGDFRPGEAYTVALAKGLPATDDAVLQEEFRQKVELRDLDPSVDFESQGMFLAAKGYHAVALQTVNVPAVNLTVDRVYLNNLFSLFQYESGFGDDYGYAGYLSRSLGDRVATEAVEIGGGRNRKVTTPLALDPYIEGTRPGFYRVCLSRPGEWQAAQRWLLLTDLGVVAKRGGGELLVWVSSFRDLAPVGGARVTLLSDQNQALGAGRTDGAGFWRLREPDAAADGARPYLLTVERGDDFTFVLLDRMAVDTTGLDVGGAASAGRGYTAFLYGERDLYRPGETAQGMAVVRRGDLAPPAAMPALLRHRDAQGRELETRRLAIDGRGLAEFALELPEATATGNHTLELEVAERVIGRYPFQVEEFIPDRIKVEISPPAAGAPAPVPGGALAYRVASSYLFGPPAAGLPVATRVRLTAAPFTAKGYEAFTFTNPDRSFQDREILVKDAALDAQGLAEFRAAVPSGLTPPSSLAAVVTARVMERGGRGVSALTRLAVHPFPAYLGLRRLGEGYPEPGQEVALEFVAVSPGGKEVPAGGLRMELYLDRWNTVLRRTPAGTFRYESTRDPRLVESQALAAGTSRGRFTVRPADYGSHRVVVTDPATGASAAVTFYVSGWGYSPWAIENPARIELDLDRDEYRPGDVATVQVRAPFAGKLFLTVERDRVFTTQVHTLEGNTARITLPVGAAWRPNAYVTATLVRAVGDLEPGAVGRAFGAVPLSVERASNRLAPAIDAPAEIRSAQELSVAVTTAPGATVTVAAVDEGILQLIAQKTPDPFEFFYRKLALEVTSYDTFSLLLPEVRPEGSGAAGGGEGAEGRTQSVRTEGIRRVEPVAFWSGPLTADGAGRARVSFRLPEEFQGALRVMAVAIGAGVGDADRFGSAERTTRVRDPLVLLPTVPRVLSFGETVKLPVSLRNDTGRAGDFKLALAVEGPATAAGEAARSLAVADGAEALAYLELKTGDRPGAVRLRFTAEGNGERAKASVAVPVRSDLPPAVSERAGALDGAATPFAVEAPERYRPGTLRRELRIGALPVVQFAGRLRDLLQYPYGCLEQTVSAAFPLVYLGDLARALDPELLAPPKKGEPGRGDPEAMVAAGLRRIGLLQLDDGGFALWPGGTTAHPWASVYAAHFAVEARRAGHPVPDSLLDGALDYAAGLAMAKQRYGAAELERTAYALYVLARGGRADLGTMDFVREKHAAQLRPESRALLAAAYAAVGNPRVVAELLAGLAEAEAVERQTGGNFDSTLRNRAIVLLALLDATPDSARIPELVDRLARDARALSAWTTQESGWVFLALGAFVQRQATRPPYAGTAFAGDRKLGRFGSEAPAAFSAIEGAEPVRIELDAGYSPGSAFFSLVERGIPTDAAFQPRSAGLEIERRILDHKGGEVNLAAVRQGDLLVLVTRVRSVSGPVENVAVESLLPSGLEVENPRLETTEDLPWVSENNLNPAYVDFRDDRIVLFTDLPANTWQQSYALVRAVTPGRFRLPPVHAEAMYNPALQATGPRGTIEVIVP